jgi:hypothetical protein
MVHAYIPSTWKADAGALIQGQPGLIREPLALKTKTKANMHTYAPKKKKDNVSRKPRIHCP